jgi:hypothetical protein
MKFTKRYKRVEASIRGGGTNERADAVGVARVSQASKRPCSATGNRKETQLELALKLADQPSGIAFGLIAAHLR